MILIMTLLTIKPFIINMDPNRVYDGDYIDKQELKHSIWLTGIFDQLYSAQLDYIHKNNNILGLFIVDTNNKIDEWKHNIGWISVPIFRQYVNECDEYKVMKIVRH